MPHYRSLGEIPHKRHAQFRQAHGTLYREEVFGNEGFSGAYSTLYHRFPPTQVSGRRLLEDRLPGAADEEGLRHRHLRTARVLPAGDPISGRVRLLFNEDVAISVCRPTVGMEYFYKNADGDDLLFVHTGTGYLDTMFGVLPYRPGDYLVIPRGTIYRVVAEEGAPCFLVIESAGAVEIPRRYRNAHGQCLEHSPFCERDLRGPTHLPPPPTRPEGAGPCEVRIRARGRLTAYYYDFHPLDVVGWDGCVYPWAFSIHDFEPITGRVHQPPTVHQTFQARNYVVCSFVPRLLDYHPEAVPVPYFHSNLESDEVLYYVNGNFGSRRGIEEGSLTLHPQGLPHGPQPGIIEASLGATRTEELAVMVDTFRPLRRTVAADTLDDPRYPDSWLP